MLLSLRGGWGGTSFGSNLEKRPPYLYLKTLKLSGHTSCTGRPSGTRLCWPGPQKIYCCDRQTGSVNLLFLGSCCPFCVETRSHLSSPVSWRLSHCQQPIHGFHMLSCHALLSETRVCCSRGILTCYRPRSRGDNAFGSVRVFVCLFVCLSVRALLFEPFDL